MQRQRDLAERSAPEHETEREDGDGHEFTVNLLRKVQLMIAVNDSFVEPTINAGAPWVSLNQDGTRYFDYHHTPDDTLDKIDVAQMRQNVAAWTTMLGVLSGGIEPQPKRRSRR